MSWFWAHGSCLNMLMPPIKCKNLNGKRLGKAILTSLSFWGKRHSIFIQLWDLLDEWYSKLIWNTWVDLCFFLVWEVNSYFLTMVFYGPRETYEHFLVLRAARRSMNRPSTNMENWASLRVFRRDKAPESYGRWQLVFMSLLVEHVVIAQLITIHKILAQQTEIIQKYRIIQKETKSLWEKVDKYGWFSYLG